MDSVPITLNIVASLTEITRAAEDVLRPVAGQDDLEKTVLGPTRISLHKYQVWQQNWSGEALNPNVTAQALWGVQGWRMIRGILDEILKDSVHIGQYLKLIRKFPPMKPKSRWHAAVNTLRSKQQSGESFQAIQKLAAALSQSIDQLWIYSETVFDSLHGILAHGTKVPEPERLLTLALRSKSGSLVLHALCSNSTLNCCLEIDLLEARSPSLDISNGLEFPVGRLSYHLFAQARECPQKIKEQTVEYISDPDESELVENELGESSEPNFQLFKSQSGTGTKRIIVSGHGSNPPSCLVVPRTGIMLLETQPDSLANLLTIPKKGTKSSTVEHFSMGTKVELAFKVVECGFFLIGTPWFSSLSSKNILIMRSNKQKHPTFALEVQTVDHKDLLLDDPGALAETSQLFRLGILLMEIALDEPSRYSRFEHHGYDAESIISKLPSIEQSMGTQYCKATAFCLQHRQLEHRFQGPEKYEEKNFDQWESYLGEFLLEYHSQVFLRYAFRAVSNSHDALGADLT